MKEKELKQKSKALDPIVRIGKNGLTEGVIIQIEKVLAKRELVKVKFLRAFVEDNDRKKAGKELANKLKARLIEQVGFVVVIYRPKIEQQKKVTKVTQKTRRT